MRVLVCGSRTYGREVLGDGELGQEIPNLGLVFDVLQGVYEQHAMGYLLTHVEHLTIVEGGARGADHHAAMWVAATGPHPGDQRGINDDICSVLHDPHPADWNRYGKRAGPIRNQEMLDSGLDLVLAFVNKPLAWSRGTNDMVTRAKKEGLPVYVIEKLS